MGIINQLDRHVAELIAAGEVVERPASVVKELVENSIDAGATVVTVEIQNGGMTFIRVTDNGSGIYREDVPKAFLSHATSKIRKEEDLEGILTMGFRGEALASVAAVAKVELLTRREDELEGTRYVIAGAQEQGSAPAGCPKGTTILVRELFYNTPARLKFIKKDSSEANSVAGVLDKIAVSHPEIAFKFIRDGVLKVNTPGDGKLLSAVYAVFGRDFAKGLTEVSYEKDGLRVEGLVSKPESTRANRSMQNFFINTRFVKSRTCAAALEEAYKGAIMVGRFPACILNLTIQPHTVDVNVHPAKIEVRFENERTIFDLVYFGVKNALGRLQAPEMIMKAQPEKQVAPSRSLPKQEGQQLRISAEEYRRLAGGSEQKKMVNMGSVPKKRPVSQTKSDRLIQELDQMVSLHDDNPIGSAFFTGTKAKSPAMEPERENTLQEEKPPFQKDFCIPEPELSKPEKEISVAEPDPFPPGGEEELTLAAGDKESQYANARIIGELFSTYILLENKDKLLIVDKHAAHERILFERIKKEQADQFRQALLLPQTVTLDREEYEAALDHLDILAKCGFEAEDFGGGSLLLRTAPMWLADADLAPVISELCANLRAHKHDITPEVLDGLYHSVACRAAVKGGNKNGKMELSALIKLLEEDAGIQHCPHGRPVSVSMSRYELEKQFGRMG